MNRLVTGAMPEAVNHVDPHCAGCTGCTFQARYEWTEQISTRVMDAAIIQRSQWTDKLDDYFTHPVIGVAVFHVVMLALFALIFWAAQIPMELIDHLFAGIQSWTTSLLPPGDLQSLVSDGVVGGVGGILVFLPQICILFFALSLLEDTGYLSRAAFVMDKIMRRLGLPGKAFVPLLSAHACAIPAIMSTRVIENPRDRLVTILVTPLMACSARIPVYAMVTALLFPHSPLKAALVFTAAYAVGVATALGMALVFRRTILPGESKPLMIELPPYRVPGLRTALLHTFDRAKIFVKQAGTIILAISLVLWALSYYPKSSPPAAAVAMTAQAAQLEKSGDTNQAAELLDAAGRLTAQHSLQNSFAGKIGHVIEPAIAPLGLRLADWHRHHQFVCRARSHRFHAGDCLWRGQGRGGKQSRSRFTASLRQANALGRHADFQHGDLREPAGVLHPRGAMSVHHRRRAARDEQLEMAAVSNRLHDRAGLRRGADRVSSVALF